MMRLHIIILQLAEINISAWIHFVYCLYIFSTTVATDLSRSLLKKLKFNFNLAVKESIDSNLRTPTSLHDLPPIVLVHGIFGFGQGRMGSLQYFGGAENKYERVLVPDLGSLTSIYDRARELFYYLKGGLVDYGDDHSKACGHSQFGKFYEQVILYEWCDIPWLKYYYSFGFDHFNMSRKNMGLRALLDCLLGKSGPFASGDWILPDLTLQGTTQLNHQLRSFPNTYYSSYATKRTMKIFGVTLPSSVLGIHPLLFLRVLQMSQWCLPPDAHPPYKDYRDEDWWDNDGAINTISMLYPRLPVQHPHRHVVNDSDFHPMQPDGDHLLYIVNNKERAGIQFDLLYETIFERCRKNMSMLNRPSSEDYTK
ncbi:hypothetical protein V2J09_013116 [Rumex salicifolius]